MKTEKAIRALFWFAGFYDGVLGAIFLAAPAAVFDAAFALLFFQAWRMLGEVRR